MAKALNVSLNVNADTSQAKAALQELQNSLTSLQNNSSRLDLGLDATSIQKASSALIDLQSHLKAATNINTGTLNFAKLDASLRASKASIADYGVELLKLGPQGQKAFQQLTTAVASSEVPVKRLSSLFGEFGTVIKNTIRWQASSSLIHGFMGAIQQSFRYAQDLNKSLTNIQIVTQASDEHMAKFAESANKAAKQLSTTTTAYTNASLIYYQQGLNDKQVKERTDVTVKMANITGQSAQEVSNQLTAIWNNFADGSKSLEYYADVITALGAATASSSEEISKGLQKFAAIADTVGLSYENATAALATITATTRQSADTVGTGLRTLFSRLQSLSLGKTLEDGVNLTKYSKALKTVGVEVIDASGNLRKMDDILADLGKQWGTLSEAQQTALAQTVGGVRQYTTVMALMDNYDFYEENLKIAQNSQGTVQKQADIYAKSWEASQKRVKASAESIFNTLINDKFFISLNNTISGFLDLVNNVIDGLGGLKGVLLGIGTIATTVFKNNFAKGLYTVRTGLKEFFTPTSVWQSRKTDALNELVDMAASPNTANKFVQQQSAFLESQTRSQVWLAQKKDQLSQFDYFRHQLMNESIERDIQDYNNLITKQANMRDTRGDFRSSLFGQAFENIRNSALYQDRARAEQLIAQYGGVRNKNGEISYNQPGLNPSLATTRGGQSYSQADRQDLDRLITNGVMTRAGQILTPNNWQTTDSGFMTEFTKDFDKNIGEMILNSNWFNGKNENIIQNAYSNSQALNSASIRKQTDALLTSHGVSDSLIEAYKQGQIKFSDLGEQQLQQNISSISSKYHISRADVEQYVNMLREELQITNDIEKAQENVNKKLEERKQKQKETELMMQQEKQVTAVASSFLSLGMAISQVSGIMKQWENVVKTGEGAGQALTSSLITLSMSFMGLFSAIKGLQTAGLLKSLLGSLTAPQIALIAAGIIAAIAAISLIVKAIDNANESQKEKTERLKNNLTEIQNWASQASSAVSDLLNQKETHNNLLETLDSLKEGTVEFYNTLLEANGAAQKLISTYGLVYGTDYNYNGKGGAINFTEQGYTTMEQSAKELAYQGTMQQALATLRVTKNDNDLFNEKYNTSRADMPSYADFFSSIKAGSLKRGYMYDQIDSIVQQYMGMSVADYVASNPNASWANVMEQANKTRNAEYTPLLANSLLAYGNAYGGETFSKLSGFEQQAMVDAFTSQHGAEAYYDLIDQKEAELEKISGARLRDLYKSTVSAIVPDVDEATLKAEIAQAQVMSELGSQFMNQTMDNIGSYANYQEMTIEKLDEALTDLSQYGEGTVGKAAHDIIQTYRDNLEKSFNQKVSDLGLTGVTLKSAQAAGMSGADINNWAGLIDSVKGAFTNSDFAERFSKEIGLSIFDGQNFNAGLLGALKQIDWSSNLTSVIGLGQMAKLAKLQGATYADQITNYYEESLGSIKDTELLEDLERNGDFQDALKSLQKQFKKTGKIGAQEIEDAAESCDILNEALEYGGLSAGALGDALSLMSMGAVDGLGDISEALWAALEAANAFEDSLANAFEYIDNFGNTLSRSTQDLSDFFSKYSKDMFALLGEGNVGGERLYQEASALWGQKYSDSLRSFFISQETGANKDDPYARQKAYNERYGQFDSVMQQVQKTGNLQPFWSFMLNPKNNASITDIMGRSNMLSADAQRQLNSLNQQINNSSIPSTARDSARAARDKLLNDSSNYKSIQEALGDIGITQGKNKDIEVDVRGRTTDQMREQLMQAMNLTKDQADLYLQELAGHGAFLTQDLKTNDFMAGYNSFLDENGNIKSDMAADARAFLQSQGPQNFDLMKESLERQAQAQQTQIDKLKAKEEKGTLTEKEAQQLAELRNAAEETAKMQENLDNAKQSMEDLANDAKLFEKTSKEGVLDWENVSKTTKDALKNIAEQSKVTIKREVQSPYGGGAKYTTTTDSYDLDTVMDKAQKMGMTQEQAFEAAKKTAQSAGAEISRSWTDMYGNVHTYSQKAEGSLDEFNEKCQEAFSEAKHQENKEFGKDLFKGFIEAAEEAQLTADGLDLDLDAVINVTSEGLDAVKSDLEAVEGDHPATIAVSEDGVAAKTKGELDSIPGTYNGTVTIGGNYGVAATTASALASIPGTYEATVNITVNEQGGASGGIVSGGMSGYISRLSERIKAKHSNALGGLVNSYAIGSANRQLRPGLSLTAEEGPEIIWNKQEGYSYVVGGNGHPEFVILRPGDRVFNANQTREILNHDKPDSNYFSSILDPKNLDQRLFGSFATGDGSVYGSYGPNSTYGGHGGNANQTKKNYKPERYHVITRQIQDLTFWYEELSKAREKAYGTNILEAIDDEIKATDELIKAQQALVDEAADYKQKDLAKLKELGIAFELDDNGNIKNWEELQEKYRKAAENDKDEAAQEKWNAILQYEESLDKWQEAYSDLTDLALQKSDLLIERITEKREMKIDFDEKEIKLLDFYIGRIEDNVQNTADAIAKTSEKFKFMRDQADAAYESIDSVFENLTNRSGAAVRKADGSAYTLQDWLNMSDEERDALDINYDFGKELEEDYDIILESLESFDDLKTDAIERFGDAFSDLNDDIERSVGLFDHYKNMLSSLKDITDLQGITLAPEMKKVLDQINNNLFTNIQNTIAATQKEYDFVKGQRDRLKEAIANETDADRIQALQEQLNEAEDQMNDLEENLLGYWQEGLDSAKQMFESAMDAIVEDYESAVSNIYGTIDEFQKAWDQQKKNDDFYVKDYEKYYQISKLQRSITKDLEDAAKAGNKQNERMKKLYNDLNAARADGVELTAYDLDVFAKRYEYEKALMDLEESRNAKNEVRLQRDANGNWGYVYTSAADDDDLAAKQQKVEDTFYELQKISQDRLANLSDDMMTEMAGVGNRLKELYSTGASPEVIKQYLEQVQKTFQNIQGGINAALATAGMTEEEAKLRYGASGFDILDKFDETLLSSITGAETLDELMQTIGASITDTNTDMGTAVADYNERIAEINKWFQDNGQTAAEAIGNLATNITAESTENLNQLPDKIADANKILNDSYTAMIQYHNDWDAEVAKIENRLDEILGALHTLNSKEIAGPESSVASMASGGYTGVWGPSGKLAFLHEKEIVMNASQVDELTNQLKLLELERSQLQRTMDIMNDDELLRKEYMDQLAQIDYAIANMGSSYIRPPMIYDDLLSPNSAFDQNVHIDASFPSVTEHNEIELAFENLINKASQYANRKNMSSMTFQDMYTSKF